jgi:3-methyladenine DNA glycosylase/8-oxoguanine DNA glycosylase
VTLQREVRPRGLYSLALTARRAGDATRNFRDGRFTAVLPGDGRLELAGAAQLPDGSVILRAPSEAGLEQLRFVLAIDDDHSEFVRRFSSDPLLGRTVRTLKGLRQLRVATVAHALLRALCGQLIESSRARALERGIVRATTPRLDGLHAPPSCADFARLSPARLRALGLHARRGATLVRLCRSLELERLKQLPTAAAAARLRRERGLGPWSTGVVCLEGLGRPAVGLVGDLGLIKLLSDLRGRRVDAAETAELLEPYGDWAGLASVYLLAGYGHGLIALPEHARVRLPPARFRVAAASTP